VEALSPSYTMPPFCVSIHISLVSKVAYSLAFLMVDALILNDAPSQELALCSGAETDSSKLDIIQIYISNIKKVQGGWLVNYLNRSFRNVTAAYLLTIATSILKDFLPL
jgi:hypothetical protein